MRSKRTLLACAAIVGGGLLPMSALADPPMVAPQVSLIPARMVSVVPRDATKPYTGGPLLWDAIVKNPRSTGTIPNIDVWIGVSRLNDSQVAATYKKVSLPPGETRVQMPPSVELELCGDPIVTALLDAGPAGSPQSGNPKDIDAQRLVAKIHPTCKYSLTADDPWSRTNDTNEPGREQANSLYLQNVYVHAHKPFTCDPAMSIDVVLVNASTKPVTNAQVTVFDSVNATTMRFAQTGIAVLPGKSRVVTLTFNRPWSTGRFALKVDDLSGVVKTTNQGLAFVIAQSCTFAVDPLKPGTGF